MRLQRLFLISLAAAGFSGALTAADAPKFDYKVLATNKTSTMEKELNAAAQEGYAFASVMGGETAFGGKEVVVVMTRKAGEDAGKRFYRLLATSKTSTMQKELDQAAREGFDYCGQTVFESTFGGKEVSVILERNPSIVRKPEFKLLATSKTSTMEKELKQAGADGWEFLDVVVGSTALGGKELVSVLRKYGE